MKAGGSVTCPMHACMACFRDVGEPTHDYSIYIHMYRHTDIQTRIHTNMHTRLASCLTLSTRSSDSGRDRMMFARCFLLCWPLATMAFTLITAPAPRPEAVVDDDEEESTLALGAAPGLAAPAPPAPAEVAAAAAAALLLEVAAAAAAGWPGSPCGGCCCSSVDGGDEGSLRIEWSVSMSPAFRRGVSTS